jgi:pilus assembly protein CpaE
MEKEENKGMIPIFVQAFPNASILCLTNRWDANTASHMVQAGAKGYLLKPFTRLDLAETVQTFSKGSMAGKSEVLAFFSPKGKSGKTTMIANLAFSLARKSRSQVGIIDADLQFGDMAVFFNLMPKSTIVEAVRDVTFLSPLTLQPYFVPVTGQVSVLCGTKKPEFAEMVDTKQFSDLITMARELYRYLLIDLPRGFGPISIAACEASDLTYLVANLETGFEIMHMQRALEIFEDWQDFDDRVRTVFTRVPCNEDSRLRLEQQLRYDASDRYRVNDLLPNAYGLVSDAADNGRMAAELDPGSELAIQINKLADHIINRPQTRWGAS